MPRLQKTTCIVSLVLAAIAVSISPAASAQTAAKPAEVSKPWPQQAVRGVHGMVATDEILGSQVGVDIMKRGGNAVDAAVAVVFAPAVVHPAAGNIGGGGFMLIRLDGGKATFLDYLQIPPGKDAAERDICEHGEAQK